MAKGAKRELWKLYVNGVSTRKVCPKCGNATFMAEHKDRYTCGKCSYTEMKK